LNGHAPRFAARAALRVLPIVWTGSDEGFKVDFLAKIVLPVFGATGVAWAAAKFPAQAMEFSAHYHGSYAATRAAALPPAPLGAPPTPPLPTTTPAATTTPPTPPPPTPPWDRMSYLFSNGCDPSSRWSALWHQCRFDVICGLKACVRERPI
jgi:hypothetical protein